MLSEKYNIKNEALNYYNFSEIDDPKEYVMNYHNLIDSLQLSNEMKTKFINEIISAYIYNIAISSELDAKLKK